MAFLIINRIVAFGVQKIHIYNVSLFQTRKCSWSDNNYSDMIIQFFMPKCQDKNVRWLMVSTRCCYMPCSSRNISFAAELYLGRVMSGFSDQNWLPRSSNLMPLDCFWGFFKSKVYVRNVQKEFKLCINEIQPYLNKTIMENFNQRVRMYRRGHLVKILLHTFLNQLRKFTNFFK